MLGLMSLKNKNTENQRKNQIMEKRNPIIVALDVESAEQALRLAERLHSVVGGVKVGSQLFTIAGPDLVRRLVRAGERVFLDLKYHDIPNTVAKAVEAAARLGVSMLNVHTSGGLEMMQAAQRAVQSAAAKEERPPLVLGVTVLTSLNNESMDEVGVKDPGNQVVRLARLAMRARLDGLVCSPLEVEKLRALVPKGLQLVVPGIRPAGAEKQDQERVGTPQQAIKDGANWLVIGRPIIEAEDPWVAAKKILASIS